MNKFKVGDKVVCLRSDTLVVGQTYTVDRLSGDDGVYIKECTQGWWYFNEKFKLAEPDFCMKTQPWFIRVNNKEVVMDKDEDYEIEDKDLK